jgi:hypothetical protein
MAIERGSAEILVSLIKSITPSANQTDMDEDEPESVARLREVLDFFNLFT